MWPLPPNSTPEPTCEVVNGGDSHQWQLSCAPPVPGCKLPGVGGTKEPGCPCSKQLGVGVVDMFLDSHQVSDFPTYLHHSSSAPEGGCDLVFGE